MFKIALQYSVILSIRQVTVRFTVTTRISSKKRVYDTYEVSHTLSPTSYSETGTTAPAYSSLMNV